MQVHAPNFYHVRLVSCSLNSYPVPHQRISMLSLYLPIYVEKHKFVHIIGFAQNRKSGSIRDVNRVTLLVTRAEHEALSGIGHWQSTTSVCLYRPRYVSLSSQLNENIRSH